MPLSRVTSVSGDRQVVAVQPIGVAHVDARDCLAMRLERLALHEVHIEVGIVVVVEQGDARRQHFDHVQLARHAVDVNEVQTCVGGTIDEPLRG
jgi:DNA-directed RNA polymerase specialized sigma54-like protein